MANPTSGAPALTFSFSTQSLRVILRDGEPWFVAADVCSALDIKDTSMACSRLAMPSFVQPDILSIADASRPYHEISYGGPEDTNYFATKANA